MEKNENTGCQRSNNGRYHPYNKGFNVHHAMYSVNAWYGLIVINSMCAILTCQGFFSVACVNAFFSFGSINSVFSIFSLNSAFSIGCANTAFDVCVDDRVIFVLIPVGMVVIGGSYYLWMYSKPRLGGYGNFDEKVKMEQEV
eukprot:m.99840 g.99840  ORF g.99840 m.99840 type:complete len:142 (-) comp13684_c0_seq2:1595-2020(-)